MKASPRPGEAASYQSRPSARSACASGVTRTRSVNRSFGAEPGRHRDRQRPRDRLGEVRAAAASRPWFPHRRGRRRRSLECSPRSSRPAPGAHRREGSGLHRPVGLPRRPSCPGPRSSATERRSRCVGVGSRRTRNLWPAADWVEVSGASPIAPKTVRRGGQKEEDA